MATICVCISGQARNFVPCLEAISNELRAHDAVFIISTWQQKGLKTDGSLGTWAIERTFSPEVARSLPPSFLHHVIYEKIPPLRTLLTARAAERGTVTQEDIQKIIPDAIVEIQPDDYLKSVPPGYASNPYKMLYKIWRANAIRHDYELRHRVKFDFVLRMRMDLHVSELSLPSIAEIDNIALVTDKLRENWLSDWACLSNPTVADYYADHKQTMSRFFLYGTDSFSDPHKVLSANLAAKNVKIGAFPAKCFITADRISDQDFIDCIKEAELRPASDQHASELKSLRLAIQAKRLFSQLNYNKDQDYGEVIDLANASIAADPSAFSAHFELGRVAALKGDWDNALSRYLSAAKLVTESCHPKYIYDALQDAIKHAPESPTVSEARELLDSVGVF